MVAAAGVAEVDWAAEAAEEADTVVAAVADWLPLVMAVEVEEVAAERKRREEGVAEVEAESLLVVWMAEEEAEEATGWWAEE